MNKTDPNSTFKNEYDYFMEFKKNLEARQKGKKDTFRIFDFKKKYRTREKGIDHNKKGVSSMEEEHFNQD